MLITRIQPSLYLSGWMCAWALVSAMTAMSTSFTGLLVCRFFLGLVRPSFTLGYSFWLTVSYRSNRPTTPERCIF